MTQQPTNNQAVRPRLPFLLGLIAFAVAARLLPYLLQNWNIDVKGSPLALRLGEEDVAYPWNFSPMWAICIFGAAVFAEIRVAFLVPLVIWLIGDLGIWAITGKLDWAFHPNSLTVYGCYLLTAAIGLLLRRRRSLPAVFASGFVASVLFYLITNFGSWIALDTYPKTFAGLMACYEAGLPFFRNAIISTTFFLAILFSPLALAERSAPAVMAPQAATTTR
jgi:hypothetical protein